jgi:hypothetical protein
MSSVQTVAFGSPKPSGRHHTKRPAKDQRVTYQPPVAGPDFNRRLADDLQKRFRGDIRFQVAKFCKLAEIRENEAAPFGGEMKVRYDMGDVLQNCVTGLHPCGIRLHNLQDLTQKNVLTLTRYWAQKGDTVGTIRWRVAVLRGFFRLTGRHTPLLVGNSNEF